MSEPKPHHQSSAFKMSWETFWLGAEKQKAEKQQQYNKWQKRNIIVIIKIIIITNNSFEHIPS